MSNTCSEDYTFDNFMVDDSNRFAVTACHMVAQTPVYYINPVVIYGSNGCGKTHLLFAIAHDMRLRYPSKKVVITSAEEIMDRWFSSSDYYEDCSFEDGMCEIFSDVEVLLIDHFQYIAGKPETTDGFIRFFKRRYMQQLQTVVVTDERPVRYYGFLDKFKGVFENSVVAHVSMPGEELKRKYVMAFSLAQGCKLSHEIICFLSRLEYLPPAELRGAVMKILHYERVNGTLPDMEWVRKNINDRKFRYFLRV